MFFTYLQKHHPDMLKSFNVQVFSHENVKKKKKRRGSVVPSMKRNEMITQQQFDDSVLVILIVKIQKEYMFSF